MRNSFQITVRRDTKKAITEIQRSEEVVVEVLEKFRSVSRSYVQKPEQKEAIEQLLKGP